MSLSAALNRTMLLMRDDIDPSIGDDVLLRALRSTTIHIVASQATTRSHSAQSAIVTTALLAARTGLDVWVDVADAKFAGFQPPLRHEYLRQALDEIGQDLLPGVIFNCGAPQGADLVIVFGDDSVARGGPVTHLNATAWEARLGSPVDAWRAGAWPFGGLAAAALAAGEAVKCAMRKLRLYALDADVFDRSYAPSKSARITLAPEGTPTGTDLGTFDIISGGAICNALCYALFRIPGVTGKARIVEPQEYDLSNLNRCALQRRSSVDQAKAASIASYAPPGLPCEFVQASYDGQGTHSCSAADAVLLGADHIPTRWLAQSEQPCWLGIGATSHWAAMASYHAAGLPCAGCLHAYAAEKVPTVATIAHVSFWAGLWLATLFVRHVGGSGADASEQQVFQWVRRPDLRDALFRGPVARHPACPVENPAA